jgi:Flp pilus assembly protein TadG
MALVSRFLRNCSGNTAIIFGLSALPLLLGAGAAIDIIKATNVQTILQSAADAAALAGATSGKTDETELNEIVASYVKANGVEDSVTELMAIEPELDKDGGTFSVRIKSKMNTSFMFLAGISNMELDAYAETMIAGQGLEVALVLDNTASMNSGGRLPALKTAAKELVDIILEDSDPGNYVRIGIVPFANYVNVGMSNRSKPWIDVPDDYTVPYPGGSYWNTPVVSYDICGEEEKSWNNDGVIETYMEPIKCNIVYGPPEEITYAAGVNHHTWYGCVGSRSDTLDTKITGTTGNKYPGPMNTSCPQAIEPLTANASTLKAKIDAMAGTGETYIAPGVLWGWHLLDSNAPFEGAKTKGWMKDNKGVKTMVIMTDGDNTKSVDPSDTKYHWSGDVANANAKTAALCDKVKNEDVVVYTVAFMVTNPDAITLLKNCASDPGKAFTADDPSALLSAFSEIANSLMAFRLTK